MGVHGPQLKVRRCVHRTRLLELWRKIDSKLLDGCCLSSIHLHKERCKGWCISPSLLAHGFGIGFGRSEGLIYVEWPDPPSDTSSQLSFSSELTLVASPLRHYDEPRQFFRGPLRQSLLPRLILTTCLVGDVSNNNAQPPDLPHHIDPLLSPSSSELSSSN